MIFRLERDFQIVFLVLSFVFGFFLLFTTVEFFNFQIYHTRLPILVTLRKFACARYHFAAHMIYTRDEKENSFGKKEEDLELVNNLL